MWSLALSNLDPQLTDAELMEVFKQQPGGDQIFSAQVRPDLVDSTKASGFVHYLTAAAYAAALDECGEIDIRGRLARGFPAEEKRKVYVRNLPRGISERELREEVERLTGPVDSVNLGTKGDFCFVTYVNFLQAERALQVFNQSSIRGQALRAEPAKQRDTRGDASVAGPAAGGSTSLHVRNLSRSTTRDTLMAHFAECGKIREVRVPAGRDGDANAGYGFVEFEDADTAAKALQRMAHTRLDGAAIEVCFAKGKQQSGRGHRDEGRGGDRYGYGGGYDDRRGGGRDDRRGGDRYGDSYGRGGSAPPYPPYPYMYPPAMMQQMAAMMSAAAAAGAGGRGGSGAPGAAAAGPYGAYAPYMAPYMAAMAAAGGRAPGAPGGMPGSSGREGGSSSSTTAFPPAAGGYGAGMPAPLPGAAPGAMPYDPRYAAMYAQMMAASGAAGSSGSRRDSRRRSRSKSPGRRRDRSSDRSASRSRSRSRDRKRR